MSNRSTIIDEIIDLFEDISGIGEVSRKWKAWDQVRDFPALFINAGPETYRHNTGEHYDSSVEVVISGYVKDEKSPDGAIDDHLSDTIVALDGLNRAKFLVSSDSFGRFYAPFGIFELIVRIDYEFSLSNP